MVLSGFLSTGGGGSEVVLGSSPGVWGNSVGMLLGSFLPCRGIVFTHGVWMGGRWEKVCLGCISETVRCRKLILSRDIG